MLCDKHDVAVDINVKHKKKKLVLAFDLILEEKKIQIFLK